MSVKTRNASNALRAARLTETLLIALTAFSIVLACSVLSAERTMQSDDLVLALVCALLASGAWWWTHRVSERQVALRVDERLGLGGAFLTAWEVAEGLLPRTSVARALEERVSQRVPGGQAVRASLPRSMYWLAGPLLGGAILALALQEVRDSRDRADPVLSTRALASGLTSLRSSAGLEGAVAPEDLQELERLRTDAENLAEAARDGSEEREEAVREQAQALTERLTELAARAAPDSGLRRELERAQVLADQALMALERESQAIAEADPAANTGGESGSRVSSGDTPGTIPGSTEAGLTAQSPPDPEWDLGAGSELQQAPGVFTRGRWWPSRHDELVASWVESRRNSD